MANHKSSEKRAKQTIKKTNINKRRESEVKTFVKKIRTAIAEKNKNEALKLYPVVHKLNDKLAQNGVTKKGNAARINSRLASQIAKL